MHDNGKSARNPRDMEKFFSPFFPRYPHEKLFFANLSGQKTMEHQKVNNRLPDCTDATTKTINYYHKASNNVSQTQRDVFIHIFMKSLWRKR